MWVEINIEIEFYNYVILFLYYAVAGFWRALKLLEFLAEIITENVKVMEVEWR